MSSIPPANIIGSIAQAAVTQKQRAEEEDSQVHRQTQQTREQAAVSDKQQHQVEDAVETETSKVKRRDEEEGNRRRNRKDQWHYHDADTADDSTPHIDVQA